jgi:hypothetical protein
VGVRERKRRQEGEGLRAMRAATTPDSNPSVMFIVCLLAAPSVADDRITFTKGAPSQQGVSALFGPILFELVRRKRKWDKENRSSSGLCSGVDLSRIQVGTGAPLLLKRKSQLEENNASRLQLLATWIRKLAG